MFCWGRTVNGELGLGGIEEEHILTPREAVFPRQRDIVQVGCGLHHTLFRLDDGSVFSCGNNDVGQLAQIKSRKRPEHIERLSMHIITLVACGTAHSLAVNDCGQIFAWGRNHQGQCGLGTEEEIITHPTIVKYLATKQTVQVVCGSNHSLALLENGQVWAWGQNSHGQLGTGSPKLQSPCERRPVQIRALEGLPLYSVAAGGEHSVALSLFGGVFVWGRNHFGQLGLGDYDDRPNPIVVRGLRSQYVRFVCCGEDHTAALTKDGGVFTFGSGTNGQLGHGSQNNEILPRKVLELMGISITQLTCGRRHTLVYEPRRGRVLAFGLGGSGQLGTGQLHHSITPVITMGPWVSVPCSLLDDTSALSPSVELKEPPQLATGDVSFFPKPNSPHLRNRSPSPRRRARSPFYARPFSRTPSPPSRAKLGSNPFPTHSFSDRSVATRDYERPEPMELSPITASDIDSERLDIAVNRAGLKKLPKMEHPDAWIVHMLYAGGDQSFALCNQIKDNAPPNDFRELSESPVLQLTCDKVQECIDLEVNDSVPLDLMDYIETVFTSPPCVNASFPLLRPDTVFNSKQPAFDLTGAKNFFSRLRSVRHPSIVELLLNCLENELLPTLPSNPIAIESLRIYLILPLCHLFEDTTHSSSLVLPLANAMLALKPEMLKTLEKWWSLLEAADFSRTVQLYKKTIQSMLNLYESREEMIENAYKIQNLESPLKVLEILNRVNKDQGYLIPYEIFYIPEFTTKVDIRIDYLNWIQAGLGAQGTFFFCNYPFVFDAEAKTMIMQTDALLQMQSAMDEAFRRNFTSLFVPVDPTNPYLVLYVTRDNIVQGTLNQLTKQKATDLKKPLKVIFCGEDAVDAGGVRKEFFMLLLKDVIDPKYGMFKVYEETNSIWFNEKTFEDDSMFYLIGILCGLAIYNGNIVNLPFPLVLYKKLLSEQVQLDDLKGLSPSICRSLHELLLYEGDDVEEAFLLRFDMSLEAFDEVFTYELKPGGSTIPVTKDNREEYVKLYVNFILSKAVEKQYEAFHKGFHRVCGGRVLELFHAPELMAMIVGNENYDWKQLQQNAEYKQDFSASHPTIQMFWEVFHSLTFEQKKKFLLFLTGYDRIPIFGMKSVKIIIQPTGGGENFLPVAHTCFNLLDLPRYNSKESLRQKLILAIEQTQGFGLA